MGAIPWQDWWIYNKPCWSLAEISALTTLFGMWETSYDGLTVALLPPSFLMLSPHPNASRSCRSPDLEHQDVCYESDKAFHLAPLLVFMPILHQNMIYPSYQPYSCTVANRQPESLCSLQSDTQGGIEGEPPAVNSHGLGGSTVSHNFELAHMFC